MSRTGTCPKLCTRATTKSGRTFSPLTTRPAAVDCTYQTRKGSAKVKKPEIHTPDITKMVQLTMEQLQGMNGDPVWVQFEDGSGGLWGIVHITIFSQIVFPNGLHCTIGHPYYGKVYKAYTWSPASIDREAWEPCDECKTCGHCKNNLTPDCYYDCEAMSLYEPNSNFCEYCGRPLTEAAWKAPEKRFTGRAT